jgi:dinuclear metal center YbgI/SA1388 family protein
MSARLADVIDHLDALLDHASIGDYPGAKNGLQLENSGEVTHIATAVDANALTIERSIELEADLLLVHHGIGWNDLCPVTGGRYRWLKQAIDSNLAIYSSHLPLDAHDVYGNNILLAQAMGLKEAIPYFEEKQAFIGRKVVTEIRREDLLQRLKDATGTEPHSITAGPETCRSIAIITGGGGNFIHQVAADGVDTFISGEASHWVFSAAQEYGMNLILGGHYATETFGVKALGDYLSEKFSLPSEFIDVPSGL